MNLPITDLLDEDCPEVIEECLHHGNAKCVAFNRRGTLLAAGCSDGSCVIWDFETRSTAMELRDEDCTSPITSLCWSKNGRYLLASAIDRSLTLWKVSSGEKITRHTLNHTVIKSFLYPGSGIPSLCLVCCLFSAPVLVDLNTGSSTVLPYSLSDAANDIINPQPRNKFIHGSPATPKIATFDKHGDLIYIGNPAGEILIVDTNTIRIYAIVAIPGGCVIKDIVFSRNGQYLLINSSDRVVRIYENLLQPKGAGKELEEIGKSFENFHGIEKLKEVGAKCLRLLGEFQDSVNKTQWKAPCFGGDGKWIIGASASRGDHKLYIWNRTGHLVNILEGPNEPLIDLHWHPIRNFVVSVSTFGKIYIWANESAVNWSAFAPDFIELDENVEYVEREDEFDLIPELEKMQVNDLDMDEEEVDILTVERDPTFSELDESEDELSYLPVRFNTPEQQNNIVGGLQMVEESHHNASAFSVEEVENSQSVPPSSIIFQASANSETGESSRVSRRQRKLSAKGLEFAAERARKPTRRGRKTSGSRRKT